MKLSKKFNRFIATLALALFTTVATLTLSTSSVLAATIQEEGIIYAGNVTEGVGFTHAGVTAKDNETVAFEIFYHDLESADSGLNAQNVNIKATLPTGATTVHTVDSTVHADNSNVVNDSTTVTTTDATTLQFIPGTVTWKHDTGTNANPNWVTQTISDSVVTGANGAVVDQNEQPSNNFAGTIVFQAKIVPQPSTPPPTPPTPTYTCTELGLAADVNRTVKISSFSTTQTNGAVFKNAVISWGDNSATLTSTNPVGQSHQYAADGTYTVSAVAHFKVNGQDVTADGTQCQQKVTFTTTAPPTVTPPTTPPAATPTTPAAPTALVNTGPGSVVALFGAATAIGTFGYRWVLSRRLSRQ